MNRIIGWVLIAAGAGLFVIWGLVDLFSLGALEAMCFCLPCFIAYGGGLVLVIVGIILVAKGDRVVPGPVTTPSVPVNSNDPLPP